MSSNVPDYVERKGSLFLRSDHMNYSRATLNSNWHQAREAEPKEYDISQDPVRDLHKATYNRIGNVTNGDFPRTTYQASCDHILIKEDYAHREPTKHIINKDTVDHLHLDRETGTPQKGFGTVLPSHNAEYDKLHLDTTHKADYKPPYPYTPVPEKSAVIADHSPAYKHCQSQFTDTADYRRWGRNTWQDESGIYHNSHLKLQAPSYTTRDPILEAFK